MGRIDVVVSPGARRTELVGRHGDAWKVRVAAPPERGRANEELVRFLADLLGVPRGEIAVVAGGAGRRKLVDVRSLSSEEAGRRLAAA